MKNFFKNNIYYFILILLSVPSVIALFHKGFYGASDDLHIAWLYEMDKIIKIGQFPPRFVPDLSFGFGYPLFNFVFPLPFYLGEIFHLLSFSFVDSIKFVLGFSLVASGVSMYLLLKEFLRKDISLVGALVYIYTPYRSTDVYVRGAVGEALAFVFLPLVIYAIIKIITSRKYVALLAISLAALILSHDIVSYMFFPFLLLLILMLVFTLKKSKTYFLVSNFLGIISGLLLSSYFWVPAIIESKLMAYETVFNFKDHFPTIKQLITPYFGYGASVPGPYDLMSFFIGHINLILLVLGGIFFAVYRKKFTVVERTLLIWSFIVFFISVFMMNYRSSFVWDNIPYLPYFQFPWRFLTLTTFSSVLFLLSFKYFSHKYLSWIVVVALGLLTLGINYNYFKPHDFLERMDSYYINRYIPIPTPSSDYLTLQEEYLRLPLATKKRPNKVYPLIFSDSPINFTVLSTDGLNAKIQTTTTSEQLVYYNKYYFPGWTASVDGKQAVIMAGFPFGQISLDLPKGGHIVEFRFNELNYKLVLDTISLVVLVSLIIYVKKIK